ncbi:MAG: letm1 and EF-hand domain-containing protein 1, mitochondrial, variant 2 [Marteilia pararefringens]
MRLFFLELRVSTRLLSRTIIDGGELSRRERRQLIRTLADVLKIFPYFMFLVVPLLEFLLPLYIKFFPFMLPSTFKTKSDKKLALKKSFQKKLEIAKVLQDTLETIHSIPRGQNDSERIASTGREVSLSNMEISNMNINQIITFLKDFEDELTLDKLDKAQILQLCKLLSLPTVGPLGFLRFQLRLKAKIIKNDDKAILLEGINNLTRSELREALKTRGLSAYQIPEDVMRSQLNDWVTLSIVEKIPASILLLSSAVCTNTGQKSLSSNLSSVIKDIPEELKNELKYAKEEVDSTDAIKVIQAEEESIKEENMKTTESSEEETIQSMDETTGNKLVPDDDTTTKIIESDFDNIQEALESVTPSITNITIEQSDIEDFKEDMKEFEDSNLVKDSGIEETKNMSLKKKNKSSKLLEKKIDSLVDELDDISNNISNNSHNSSDDLQKSGKNSLKKSKTNPSPDISKKSPLKISRKDLLKSLEGIKNYKKTDIRKAEKLIECLDTDRDGIIQVNNAIELLKNLEKDSDNAGLSIDQLSILSGLLKGNTK